MEKFERSDLHISSLTGLPNYGLFSILYRKVLRGEDTNFLHTFDLGNRKHASKVVDRRQGGKPHAMNPINQLFMTMCRVRTGMSEITCSAVFNVAQSTISAYYR